MVERPRSPWADALAAFAENRGAVLALAILALIALAGIFAPFVAPHSGVGGCAPSPRNPRPAASMMASDTPSAATTRIGAVALGNTVL
ncbi:MAG: hypothetical protein KGQ28_04425, partial [Hyphomicrobiales bacterium]|nr:hypothetical protein [Hyphomicrobiales bacterium]